MIRIISKKVTVRDRDKKPQMYRVIFTDGKTTWFGDLGPESVRQVELRQKFEEHGYNMKLIEEYRKLAYQEGQNQL